MAYQRGARFLAEAGDDVDDARRQAGVLEELRPAQDRAAGLLGRLDDNGVTGRERRAGLGRDERHRRVPRQHEPDDAERFAPGEVEAGVADVDRLAVQLVGGAGEEVQDLHARRQVAVERLLDNPSGVEGFEVGELADVRAGHLGERAEVPGAHLGVEPRPFGCGRRRGADGGIDIGGVAARDARPHLARRRVRHVQRAAGPRAGTCGAADVVARSR